jgi:hypothetical protein
MVDESEAFARRALRTALKLNFLVVYAHFLGTFTGAQ